MTNPPKDQNKEYLFKEIDLIQDIIKRMANNSFLIKGWTVTLIVIVFLFRTNTYQILFAFIPLIAFWILDGYFLRLERLYRELYKWVISNRFESLDNLFDLNAHRFSDKVDSLLRVCFSHTLFLFYGAIFIIVLLASILTFCSI